MQTVNQQAIQPSQRRRSLLGLGLATVFIVVAAAALRWFHIGAQSLWFDEGYSAWVVSLRFDQIVDVIRADVSPPLYYLLLKEWTSSFGDGEVALRSLSAIAACLAVPLIGATAWHITRSRPASLVAMLALATSVLQVQFAQEARSYGIASFLALLAFYAAARCATGACIWLLPLWLACVACVYLHNMMWFYLAAVNVAYLIMPNRRRLGPRIAHMAILDIAVILAYAWWIPALLGQMRWLHGNFWASVPSLDDLSQVLVAAGGMKLMHLSALFPQYAGRLAAGVLGLICLLALIARSRDQFRWTAAILLFGLLPILAVFGYAHASQSYFVEKVFTASTITIPLLAGLACVGRLRHLAWPATAILLAGSAISLWGYFRWEQKEDWRSASACVNQIPHDDTLAIFVANEGELLYRYYTRHSIAFAHDVTGAPQSFLDLNPPKTIQRVLRPDDLAKLNAKLDTLHPSRVALVLSHTDFSDPQGLTRDMIRRRMSQVSDKQFHLLRVEVYEAMNDE